MPRRPRLSVSHRVKEKLRPLLPGCTAPVAVWPLLGVAMRHGLAVSARDVRRQRHGRLPAKARRVPKPAARKSTNCRRKTTTTPAQIKALQTDPQDHRKGSPRAVALRPPGRGRVRSSRASADLYPCHQRGPEIEGLAEILLTSHPQVRGIFRWKSRRDLRIRE